jgi:hypothetical protein
MKMHNVYNKMASSCLSINSGIVTNIQQLSEVSGNAKLILLYCTTCGVSNLNLKWSSSYSFLWALVLCCNICGCNWTVCTVCQSIRSQLSGYMVKRHHNLKHQSKCHKENLNSNPLSPQLSGIMLMYAMVKMIFHMSPTYLPMNMCPT